MGEREPDEVKVRQAVVDIITEILPDIAASELTDDLCLRDLGADSTEQAEITLALKDRTGVELLMPEFTTINNIGELVSYLSRNKDTSQSKPGEAAA